MAQEARVLVRGFAAQPETFDEVVNVFEAGQNQSQRVTQGFSSRVLSLDETPANLGMTVLRQGGATDAGQTFLEAYASSVPGQNVVLVGHNAGGLVRMTDESFVDLRNLSTEGRGILTVISCSSLTQAPQGQFVGLPVDVAFDFAYEVTRRYNERMAQIAADQLTVGVAQAELDTVLRELAAERQVRLEAIAAVGVVTGGGGVVGTTIYFA